MARIRGLFDAGGSAVVIEGQGHIRVPGDDRLDIGVKSRRTVRDKTSAQFSCFVPDGILIGPRPHRWMIRL